MNYDQIVRGESAPYPAIIDVELSAKCNLRCRFCHLNYFGIDEIRQISYRQFEEHFVPILPHIKSLTLFRNYEPLTCRDFIPIFRKISEFNIETYFSSNGLLMNDEVFDAIVGHLTYLTISVNGFTSDRYQKEMCFDGYAKVRENLTKLNEWKKDRKTLFPILRISTIAKLDSLDDIIPALDFAKEFEAEEGVQLISLQAMDEEMASLTTLCDEKAYTKATQAARAYAESIRVKLVLQSGDIESNRKQTEKLGHKFCRLPWNRLSVQPNGDVYPCNVANTVIGNLFEEPLPGIWNGSRMEAFRASVNDEENMNEDCRHCKHCRLGSVVRKNTTDFSDQNTYISGLKRKIWKGGIPPESQIGGHL